jgi:hypothetical protein
MPRFVILEHDHPVLHWDLMLETGEILRTWRLAVLPKPKLEIPATYLSEHRRMYLDYEGPVSGNRGRVARWDSGTYSVHEEHDDQLGFVLDGGRLKGTAELIRKAGNEWIFRFGD